jgi:DNA polymerase-3 subunit delta
MPKGVSTSTQALALIHGDDEFAIKHRARQLYDQWCRELGGEDHEILDGQVGNSGEALQVLARLREALNTLPFFGSGKAVWLRNCNFLGEERTASAEAVTESLASLAQELKSIPWGSVRLLISSGKVDKRRVFYKSVEKMGSVESLDAWSMDQDGWMEEASAWSRREFQARNKTVTDDALAQLVSQVGPHRRFLASEIEKLALYVNERETIQLEDVEAVVTLQKHARSFAVADALGERNLPRLMKVLDEEIWAMRTDSKRTEIGLLYGLITKVRTMLFAKELLTRRWIRSGTNFGQFQVQLRQIPTEELPADKRFNPLSMNPYLLYKALPHAGRYTLGELVRALTLLLDCNRRLVSSQLDETLLLQQTLIRILRGATSET